MSTSTAVPSTTIIEPGRLVGGRYLLLSPVGRGGSGSVWRAHDQLLDREVAVKRLDGGPVLDAARERIVRERAHREGRVAARLHHPRLASIYDMTELDGEICLVMEYLDAPSLADLLQRTGPLPAPRVAAIGTQIAEGLAAMHRCGVVHRDVKPSNIMIGSDDTVTITDFGIAVINAELGTTDHLFAGTPRYMAPELARGDAPTAAADLFSLGATLHTALTGTTPASDERALEHATYGARPTRSTELLGRALRALLDHDPQRRPDATTAARLLTEINTTAAGTHEAAARSSAAGWHPPGDAEPTPEIETDGDATPLGPPPVLVDPALEGCAPRTKSRSRLPRSATPLPGHVRGRHRAVLTTSWRPSRRAVGVVAALAGGLGAAGLVTFATESQQEPPQALPTPTTVQPLPTAGPPIVPATPSSGTSTPIKEVASAAPPRSATSGGTTARAADPGGDASDVGDEGLGDTGGNVAADGSRGGPKGNGSGNGRGHGHGHAG